MDRARAEKSPEARAERPRQEASADVSSRTAWIQKIGDGTTAAPQAAGGQPSTSGASPEQAPSSSVLVEDGEVPATGQIGKGAFLDQLEANLVPALGAALAGTGFSAESCPVIVYWMSYYRGRSAPEVERALQVYTGAGKASSAQAYLGAAVARVVAGALAWRASGETDAPAGPEGSADAGAGGPSGAPDANANAAPVMALAGDSSRVRSGDPKAMIRSLGPGRPLPADVRRGMESGLGADLSNVRLHTDARAGRLADDVSARAFAVGDHVAFGAGMYTPGSLVGDLVIAHELAHTLQQSGRGGALRAGGPDGAETEGLERSADVAAATAVMRMRQERGEPIPDHQMRAHADLLSSVRSEGPAHAGLRLQRCNGDKKKKPWWEEVPEAQKGSERDVYFRPVSHAGQLRDLLRQVDMMVTFDPSKEVSKTPPGKKASERYVPGSVTATQWTSPEVKKQIDAILPPGGATIVTKSHIDQVKKVVDDYRAAHPDSFSKLQGVEAVNCAATGACIGTMNKLVEKLYGPTVLQTKDLDDSAFGTIDKLRKGSRLSAERTFAATYTGSGEFIISTPPTEVTFSGAGKWVLDQASGGATGIHMYIMSLMNGYHSVSLGVANDGSGGAQIVWKDHHGTLPLDAAGLDAKILNYCWGYWAYWMVKQYNQDYDPDVKNAADIPEDKRSEIRSKIKPTVIKDIKQTRIAHLNPTSKP